MRSGSATTFRLVKYTVFAFLLFNCVQFFYEGANSASHVFKNDLDIFDVLVAYSSVIDTGAWLILLIAFELETAVLDDETLEGPIWWLLNALIFICYLVIASAFYGYFAKTGLPGEFANWIGGNPCTLAGTDASFVEALDEYVTLTAANCAALADGALYNGAANMFATPEAHRILTIMTWIDVINAGAWLIVVALLQIEVYMENSPLIGTRTFTYYKYSKAFWYLVLFSCAIAWGVYGDFLDTWDAILWLFAFFFIELNVLNWQGEIVQERETASAEAA